MYNLYKEGFIEVITGCMFAGKTEELIRRVNVLKFTKKKMQIFKPYIDARYDRKKIVSHNGNGVKSIVIKKSIEILKHLKKKTKIVVIDEAQFLDKKIAYVCNYLAHLGIRVMVAGLDMDFRGEPFGSISKLLAIADFITKLTAICLKCGGPATHTQRLINGIPSEYNDPIIYLGSNETYEACCRHHHNIISKSEFYKF